jgi:long-chain acyl-CoA synthetase
VGLPHETLGEELGAVVVLRDGADVDADALAEFARSALAYFEVPTRWWFRDGPLPQNTTGKVLKRLLRQEWLEGGGPAPAAGGPS